MRFAGHAFIDWDDTIAEDIRYFREAGTQASRLIAERTGSDLSTVGRRGAELDVIVARRMGLVKESFQIAWVEWLHRNGFEATIWTAGVVEIQGRKIRESGLAPWVHREAIVLEKTPERLREYIGERDPARCFVVGNSAHSDIRPALALGITAFHIEVETWAYDQLRLNPADPNYNRLERIGDLPFVLAKRFRLAV